MSYEISENFIHRRPLLPIDYFLTIDLLDSERLKRIIELNIKDPVILEAVLVASRSLYDKVLNLNGSTPEKIKLDVFYSINNYFTRMSTRATPFGLFAITSSGHMDRSISNNIINNDTIKKFVLPDMMWLTKLGEKLEKNQNILNYVNVQWNPLTLTIGNKIKLYYNNAWGLDKEINGSQKLLSETSLLRIIKNETSSLIPYIDLVEKIETLLKEKNREKVEGFINTLIESEYLITDLRPTLSNSNYIDHLISILSSHEKLINERNQLIKIRKLISNYQETNLGNGITMYLELINEMKKIQLCERYIKVDLANVSTNATLKKSILSELEDGINFLTAMSSKENERFPNVKEYINLFEESYGYSAEIPLLELLDDDFGLGNPYSFKVNTSYNETEKELLSVITNKINSEVMKERSSITLDKKDFSFEENSENLSKELEVYTKIHNLNSDNKHSIEILPNTGTDKIGKTIGRFNYIFNSIEKDDFLSENEMITVEIIEFLKNSKLLNVAINDSSLKNQLSIGTIGNKNIHQLSPNNILVGLFKDNNNKPKFYFKDSSSNKFLRFTFRHNINYKNDSFSYISRFLVEASFYGENNPFYFQNVINSLDYFPYIPEIKYKNIILYPEHWNIGRKFVRQYTIEEIIQLCKLPKYISILENDKQLALNLSSPIHKEILYKKIMKNDIVKVINFKIEDTVEYLNEYVFAFRQKSNFYPNFFKTSQKSTKYSIINNEDCYPLGSDWIYVKLYGIISRIKEFLAADLQEFEILLRKQNYISKFFYLIYEDQDKHIRVRLKLNNKEDFPNVMDLIFKWTENLKNKGLLKKISYDTYFPEIARYGGSDTLSLIETIFYIDSIESMSLLKKMSNNVNNNYFHYITSLINILLVCGLNYYEMKELIKDIFPSKKMYREEYRSYKAEFKQYVFHIKEQLLSSNLSETNNVLLIDQSLKIKELQSSFKNINQSKKEDIVRSILHMHCNRLLLDNTEEFKIMYLLRHTLFDVEYIINNNITISKGI